MTSNGKGTNDKPKNLTELVLRDLQGLLRETVGNEVIVVKYDTVNFLAKGENYASTILKVHSIIKRTKESPEENLHLIAKMLPLTEFQLTHFNSTASFNKEMFVYKSLMPALRFIEKEAGIKDENLIDLVPKYYGGRLSMNKANLDVADEDAVMLMENLKENGYYTVNRMRGLDFEHAKLALKELARYHALTTALRKKNPTFFEEAKKPLNIFPFVMTDNEFDNSIDHMINHICQDSRSAKYESRIRASVEENKDFEAIMNKEPEEPWIAINHGDFWVNNMLFRQEKGQLEDIKFIDFQISRVGSPLKDLPYFLLASVAIDVVKNHLHDLLDTYYKNFIAVLTKTGCDTKVFTRKSFDNELSNVAKTELLHCLFAAKFFTNEVAEDADLNDMMSTVFMSDINDLYRERSWLIISKYAENQWI